MILGDSHLTDGLLWVVDRDKVDILPCGAEFHKSQPVFVSLSTRASKYILNKLMTKTTILEVYEYYDFMVLIYHKN